MLRVYECPGCHHKQSALDHSYVAHRCPSRRNLTTLYDPKPTKAEAQAAVVREAAAGDGGGVGGPGEDQA